MSTHLKNCQLSKLIAIWLARTMVHIVSISYIIFHVSELISWMNTYIFSQALIQLQSSHPFRSTQKFKNTYIVTIEEARTCPFILYPPTAKTMNLYNVILIFYDPVNNMTGMSESESELFTGDTSSKPTTKEIGETGKVRTDKWKDPMQYRESKVLAISYNVIIIRPTES